ncbi:MAG: nucleotidyltransferase domain-containing protein [Hydrogenothermaceae bacterium]|nr:nucleotidyltransferase domain-containing protein [Hydrogenothermaceae bacterium]
MIETVFYKNLVNKLNFLIEKIKNCYGSNLKSIVIFGSAARGDLTSTSDIDILIIVSDSKLSLKKRIEEFYSKCGYEFEGHFLSPIIISQQESTKFHPFYLGIFENHKIIYDVDSIAKKMLKMVEKLITSGKISKKNDYWKISYEKI